jgi:hypothetical protein
MNSHPKKVLRLVGLILLVIMLGAFVALQTGLVRVHQELTSAPGDRPQVPRAILP